MRSLHSFRVDWLNHAISFLSALLGLFIAFRLENYRENKRERERVEVVKQALKQEIHQNLTIYKKTVDDLSDWLAYYDFFHDRLNSRYELVAGVQEIAAMQKKYPSRFASLQLLRSISDTLHAYSCHFLMDVTPTTGVSTSNWKTAVSSGMLSSMDYSLTSQLSQIYDWTEKEIGTSEKELYENFLAINNVHGFTVDQTTRAHYASLTKVYTFKHRVISELLAQTDWEP